MPNATRGSIGVLGEGGEVHDLYGVQRRDVQTAQTARTVFLLQFGSLQRMAWTQLIGAFSIDAHCLAWVYGCLWVSMGRGVRCGMTSTESSVVMYGRLELPDWVG